MRRLCTRFDRAVEQVALADEVGDEAVLRETVDLRRLVELFDLALVHHRDPVRQRERLLLVVGDVDEGDADLLLQRDQLELHALLELRIERGQRLVEQQQLRPVDQRARHGDALALAAGELVRVALLHAEQRHVFERLVDARADLRLRTLAHLQRKRDVLLHRHVREQRVALEHRVDVAVLRRHAGHVLAVDDDVAASRAASKPAIIRSSVVLPQPEGPSSVKNSPASMDRLTSSTATKSPKRRVTLRISSRAKVWVQCKKARRIVAHGFRLRRGKARKIGGFPEGTRIGRTADRRRPDGPALRVRQGRRPGGLRLPAAAQRLDQGHGRDELGTLHGQRLPVRPQGGPLGVDHLDDDDQARAIAQFRQPDRLGGTLLGRRLVGGLLVEGPQRRERALDLPESPQQPVAVVRHAFVVRQPWPDPRRSRSGRR